MNRSQKTAQRKKKRELKKKYEKQKALVQQQVADIRKARAMAEDLTDEVKIKQRQVQESYKDQTVASLNFLADRNGCGYYRMIWPFEILATKANVAKIDTFIHPGEFSVLKSLTSIRFQRQVEDGNVAMLNHYLNERQKWGFKYNIIYEMDDLLPEIDPSNKIAYDHFKDKVGNHLNMLMRVDGMTVSTNTLKDVYTKFYGIPEEKIMVIENTLPKFLYNFNRRISAPNYEGRKPRVFWSGSGSHVGDGGDLDFMYQLIRETTEKYQWVLQGAIPPQLKDLIDAGKIESHPWQTCYDLASYQFHVCRPDVYVATVKPSRFNACKSDLKLLEASALGVPFIGTSFIGDPTYDEYPSPYDATPATALLNGNVEEWVSNIDRLIENTDDYMEQVNSQYDYLNGRWMESEANIQKWMSSLTFNNPRIQK